MKQPQSKADLDRHLQDSIVALQLSSLAYDDGFTGEAKRLATTARVLLHDTAQSQSLLGLLGLKSQMTFFASPYLYDKANLLTENHLILMNVTFHAAGGSTCVYKPVLDDGPPVAPWKELEFSKWWDQRVICDNQNREITRRKLVLWLANKDGGAHVDPKLDEVYADLSRNNSFAWETCDAAGNATFATEGPELATMRQIAHELLKTFAKLLK